MRAFSISNRHEHYLKEAVGAGIVIKLDVANEVNVGLREEKGPGINMPGI
jgi:hypothetical protein